KGVGASGTNGALVGQGTSTYSGAITLGANSTIGTTGSGDNFTVSGGIDTTSSNNYALTLNPALGSTLTQSTAALTGGGALTMSGAGTAILSADNSSYT